MDGYKRCTYCEMWVPLTGFSPMKRGGDGRHSQCRSCRSAKARIRLETGLRKDCPKPGRMGETNPGAWKWPRDDRPIHDKLRDVQLRKWARCVQPGQLLGRVW